MRETEISHILFGLCLTTCLHAEQEALRIFEEAKPLAESQELWSEAVAAEKAACEACLAHFKSETEVVALQGLPAKIIGLPVGKLQPLPAFSLNTALQELPGPTSVSSPR